MTGRPIAWRRWVLAAAAVIIAVLDIDCGARSSLSLPEPCGAPGRQRRCHNTCGEGTETCEDGFWQACVVPPATRACSNTCGPGEQRCIDDAWQTCEVPIATRPCSTLCGPGKETCTDDAWKPCDAPVPGPPVIHATIRDFPASQPDFIHMCCGGGGVDHMIVAADLSPDGKPVYAGDPSTLTTHGKDSFDQWYNDIPGANRSQALDLRFSIPPAPAGTYAYLNLDFHPIDGLLYGNQGNARNADFTVEGHTSILYTGGESYTFEGDDDLWVFLNGHRVVDLGGIHSQMSMTIDLDSIAAQNGLVKGQSYPLDIFYADRQPPGAVLGITIPQTDIWSCP